MISHFTSVGQTVSSKSVIDMKEVMLEVSNDCRYIIMPLNTSAPDYVPDSGIHWVLLNGKRNDNALYSMLAKKKLTLKKTDRTRAKLEKIVEMRNKYHR